MKKILLIDIPRIPVSKDFTLKSLYNFRESIWSKIHGEKGLLINERDRKKDLSRGILCLAAYLKNHGHNADYISTMNNDLTEILNKASEYDIVGITATTPIYPTAKEIAEKLKNLNKDILLVLGGYHGTYLDADVLESSKFDIVVRGEGEAAFESIARGVNNEKIKGITYRDKNNVIKKNLDGLLLPEEEIPAPDYDILPDSPENYRLNITTMRGCKFRCLFCINGFFWKNERYNTYKELISELRYLARYYKPMSVLHFCDNIFGGTKQRLIELCDLLKGENLPFYYSCDLRSDYIDQNVVDSLSKANFIRIMLGFEDSSELVLSSTNKKMLFHQNIDAAKIIKSNSDMLISAYWQWGLPGTTESTLNYNLENIRFLIQSDLVDEIRGGMFVPLPGTPYFNNPEKYDLKILTREWEKYIRDLRPVYRLKDFDEHRLHYNSLCYDIAISIEYHNKLLRHAIPN